MSRLKQTFESVRDSGTDRDGQIFAQLAGNVQEFVYVVLALTIGGAIVYKVGDLDIVSNSTLVSDLVTQSGDALSIFAVFLVIIAIALAGRYAMGAFGGMGGSDSKT